MTAVPSRPPDPIPRPSWRAGIIASTDLYAIEVLAIAPAYAFLTPQPSKIVLPLPPAGVSRLNPLPRWPTGQCTLARPDAEC